MIQTFLRISLLLGGYLILGIGALSLILVFKFMLDIFPEILMMQIFGLLMALLGFWGLNQYDKIYRTKQSWRRE